MDHTQGQTLIRGPQLRKRWGMSNTAFYAKLKKGVIPAPAYPFQDNVPYWTMSDIEAFERRAAAASTRPLPADPPLRRKKRAEAAARAEVA